MTELVGHRYEIVDVLAGVRVLNDERHDRHAVRTLEVLAVLAMPLLDVPNDLANGDRHGSSRLDLV